ncbi:hypothetical protein PENSPDRAFT_652195 [Peniophora sp. CONT]|nr:hypothetical protein PENSPDRAFT_652195 [Peniophora sp. CONT]
MRQRLRSQELKFSCTPNAWKSICIVHIQSNIIQEPASYLLTVHFQQSLHAWPNPRTTRAAATAGKNLARTIAPRMAAQIPLTPIRTVTCTALSSSTMTEPPLRRSRRETPIPSALAQRGGLG